jgi:uncharacterized protein (TIGR02444 family)
MDKPKHRSDEKKPSVNQCAAAFWTFSAALYDKPGIAPALIRLQDRNGLDVNLLLLCCFAGARGLGALTKAELARADRAVRAWREGVVQPLRTVRRALKLPPLAAGDTADGELRRQVMGAELLGEAREQAILSAWLEGRRKPGSDTPAADVTLSLQRYASFAKRRLDREGLAALELLAAEALAIP